MIITDFGVAVVENDTHLSRWVVEQRTLEVAEGFCRKFAAYIPEGGMVVDVGACLGDHTATYSKMVGPAGSVFAFEPNPTAFECLWHNVSSMGNVCPLRLGLGDGITHATVKEDANLGAAQLFHAPGGYAANRIRVVPLDGITVDWTRLDFIKIDAEGWEPKILRGAEQTLRRLKPVVLCEINRPILEANGSSAEEIISFMHGLGYTAQAAEPENPITLPQVDVLFLPQ